MRIVPIITGQYYHIYNRGNNKQKIFFDKRDYARMLFLILYFQSPAVTFKNIDRHVSYFLKHGVFPVNELETQKVIKNRAVELVVFTQMPNHLHLLASEVTEGGIADYMQRIGTSFTKYSNKKYDRCGHTFQGPYQYKHIKDDNQLCYTSAYIHRNQRELREWRDKEHLYPWSSFQDYAAKNRWGELLKNDMVMERFKDGQEYKEFVDESGAKETKDSDDEIFFRSAP